MRTLVFLSILTLNLASAANAGLDSDAAKEVVAIYNFETLNYTTEHNSPYTDDSGYREAKAFLLPDASIVNNGKFEKGLRLQKKGVILGSPTSLPLSAGKEFSIVAWVKLQKQQTASPYLAMRGLDSNLETQALKLRTSITISIAPSGNFGGKHTNFTETGLGLTFGEIGTENSNISNNRWHHIAFTRYANTYTVFLNGEVMASQASKLYGRFMGNMTVLGIGTAAENSLTGSAYFDDVGFFETGFSSYEIKGLYNDGLSEFLATMPVDPQSKITTTWGEIKNRR